MALNLKTMKRQVAVVGLVGLLMLAFCGRGFGQTETVVNGGFESGTLGWQGSSASGAQVTTNAPGYAGAMHLAISTVPGVSQMVYQTVTIPANTIAASFSCYYNIQTADGGNTQNAEMMIQVTDATGLNVLANLTKYNTDHDRMQGAYHQATFDLSPFVSTAGGQLQVQLWVLTAANAINGGTIFNFDNVSLLTVDASARPANDAFANATVLTNTAVTLYATNTYASKEPGEPKHAGNAGGHSLWWTWTAPAYGTVSITTDGSNFDTLLAAYTGAAVDSLTVVKSNDNDNTGATSAVSFQVSPGTQYYIAVDGAGGATGIVLLNLLFKLDLSAPSVAITSPASGAKVTTSSITVTGTASDNLNVALVIYRLENANGTNDYLPATGTNHWSATVTNLALGLNTVRVRAFDTSSNMSAAVSRTFNYILGGNYSLSINGTGTVSPDLTQQTLEVGQSYTLTAKPGNGFVFSNWDGTISSTSAKLTFVMQSNMVLEANFIPNPFTPAKGTYAGLFTNSLPATNSGFFSATVTDKGSFSARLQTFGHTYPLSGQFAVDGSYSNSIARRGQNPLEVQLQLDLAGGDLIIGTVADGDQVAGLIANRAVFSRTTNPAPMGGQRYTLLLAGAGDAATGPGGLGYGALSVDTAGNLSFGGTLGDGTKVAQKTFIAKDGSWPVYLPLYSNQGAMFGWLGILSGTNGILPGGGATNGGSLTGILNWVKPSQAKAKFYPAGFEIDGVWALGTSYTNSKSALPLTLTNGGLLTLDNGNLAQTLTTSFQVGAKNKITSTNKLVLSFTATTGLFKGSVPNPDTGKPIVFGGAVIQGLNAGAGCFLGTNQSGSVTLGPLP